MRRKKIRAKFTSSVKCERIVRQVYARNILCRRRSSSMPGYLPSHAGAVRLTNTEIRNISTRYSRRIENCVKCKSRGKISRRWILANITKLARYFLKHEGTCKSLSTKGQGRDSVTRKRITFARNRD